jgi:hypothetical protein
MILQRVYPQRANRTSASVHGNREVDLDSTELCAVPVDVLARQPDAGHALWVLAVAGLKESHGCLLTVLAAEDGSSGLEERPEVLVSHHSLAAHVLGCVNHALALLC